MANVLIVCGGTGGHLTPGIAIADTLTDRGHDCTLIVSRKKVDARLIQNYPELNFIEAPGAPFSKKPLPFMKFLWVQCAAFLFSIRLLSKLKPDLIVGFGGFLTAGVALPGCLRGIPFALHEANRVVGRSNRILSRFADRVFLPTGVELKKIKPDRIAYAGLPLRKEFVPLKKEEAKAALGIDSAEKLLVVFGGSQGATSLNKWAYEHSLGFAMQGVSVYCLTGLNKDFPEELLHNSPQHGKVRSWFVPFSDSMPAVLSAADLVVSRAGAGSISEIIRCRVPAILIPYPFARDDHQTANANFVTAKEAAVLLDESKLHSLFGEVTDLLSNQSRREELINNLKQMDNPAEVIYLADSLEELISVGISKHSSPSFPPKEA